MAFIIFLPGGSQKAAYPVIAANFFMGVLNSGRAAVAFCYMCELAPEKYHSYLGSVWNSSEGAIYIWLTLYFMNNKNWLPTQLVSLSLFGLALVTMLFIPESPKWLFD